MSCVVLAGSTCDGGSAISGLDRDRGEDAVHVGAPLVPFIAAPSARAASSSNSVVSTYGRIIMVSAVPSVPASSACRAVLRPGLKDSAIEIAACSDPVAAIETE